MVETLVAAAGWCLLCCGVRMGGCKNSHKLSLYICIYSVTCVRPYMEEGEVGVVDAPLRARRPKPALCISPVYVTRIIPCDCRALGAHPLFPPQTKTHTHVSTGGGSVPTALSFLGRSTVCAARSQELNPPLPPRRLVGLLLPLALLLVLPAGVSSVSVSRR
jgi:hypothetical protein